MAETVPGQQYLPAGHTDAQGVVAPGEGFPKVPAAHSMGAPTPAGQYLPAGHLYIVLVERVSEPPYAPVEPAGQ